MTKEEQIYNLVKEEDPANPLQYVMNIVKPMAHEKLNSAIFTCEDCAISCDSVKTLTSGNCNASIMIIGESVSLEQQEGSTDGYAFPFEDSAGVYLQQALENVGVNMDELFFINSVNCFPNRNGQKRSSTVAERTNCKTFLDYAIKIVEPLMIICLGAVAVNGINEEIGKQKISDIRGNYFTYRGITVMPTFHPGYFNELEGKFPDEIIDTYRSQFMEDIYKAITDLNNSYEDLKIIS